MRKFIVLAAAIALVPISAAPAQTAPKRVEGKACYFPVRPGTWVGFFDGGYEETGFNGHDYIRQVTIWRCFKTKADCTAWKYWVQTDYYGPASQTTWCRRK